MSTELQVIKSLLPALSKPVVKSKKKSLLTGAGIGLGTLGALGGASVLSDHYSRKKLVNNAKDIIALSGAGAGGLGGLGLATLLTDNAWLKALGALGGGVAGGLGGKYLSGKYASTDKKYAMSSYNNPDYIIEKQKENAKALKEKLNNYVLTYGSNPQGIQYLNELNKKNKELELDYKLLNADYQKVNNKYHELNQLFNLSRALNRATLGAGVGGLGGYGLTSLMTKNKWLRALGALGGGVVGGAVGYNPVYWRNKTRDLWYDTKSYADKAINKFKNKK